jgi:hypothetical protein
MDTQDTWDINFFCQYTGQQVIPFKYFANPPSNPVDPNVFTRLLDLPLELVHNVLRLSDAPTKFQWMRTSRAFRSIAWKYFWTDTDVWFQISQHESIDPVFAKHMVQIVLEPLQVVWVFQQNERTARKLGLPQDTLEHRIREFWRFTLDAFPSARNIILMGSGITGSTDVLELLQKAPEKIHAIFADRKRIAGEAPEYQLWELDSLASPPQLRHHETTRLPRLVIPPRKPPPTGPLGDHIQMGRIGRVMMLEERGIEWLLKESHLQFADSDGHLTCPNVPCRQVFPDREAIKAHFAAALICGQVADANVSIKTSLHNRNVIAAKRARMNELDQIRKDLWLKLRKDMGEPGTEERRAFNKALRKQVKESGSKPDRMTDFEINEYINGNFWADFDPTHVYYSPAVPEYDGRSQSLEQRIRQRYKEFWQKAGFIILRVPRMHHPLFTRVQ